MPTSGTYTFSMTRDTIIAAALRTMEVIGAGDTPSTADLSNCGEALNILCKNMVLKGLPLWCVQELTVPMVAGQASYNIGPVSTQPRPIRILQAFWRNAAGQDTEMTIVARADYNTQGLKTAQSQPNQLYYDPQLTNGIVTLYGVPPDATGSLHLVIQRSIQDFNLGTDNPDFPQEAYQMLKWCLVDELGLEYGAKMHVLQIAKSNSRELKDEFMGAMVENASVFFVPSGRRS